MKRTMVALILISCLLPWAAGAALISFDESYLSDGTPATTNWWTTLTLPQFDPALGTLQSVRITNAGKVDGEIRFESLDTGPSTVTGTLQSDVRVTNAALGVDLAVTAGTTTSDALTAYDGNTDFGGGSGRTYLDVGGTASDFVVFTGDLSPFIGTGFLVFDASAEGVSTVTGAGNLVSQFAHLAGTTVTVEYDYVPEPHTLVLLGSGLLGLVGIGRRPLKR